LESEEEVDVEKNQSRQAVQQPAILYNKRVGPEVSERPEDYTLVFTRFNGPYDKDPGAPRLL
jgi:hypothetical protein